MRQHLRNYRQIFAALVRFHPHALWHLGLMSSMVGLISLANIATPYLLKQALDALNQPTPIRPWLMVLLYALCWIATQLAFFLKNTLAASLSATFERALSLALLTRLFRQAPLARAEQKQIGSTYTVFKRAAGSFGSISCSVAWAIVPAVVELCGAALMLSVLISPILGAILCITVIGFFIASIYTAKISERIVKGINAETNTTAAHVLERLAFLPTLHLMHAFEEEARNAIRRYDRWRAVIVDGNRKISLLFSAKILIIGLGLAVSLLWISQQVINGKLSVGDFVMVNAYVIQFALPMTWLAGSVFEIQRNLVALGEAAHILQSEHPESPGTPASSAPGPVHFSVQGRLPATRAPIAFTVSKGQILGIRGASGSGKSTLLDALLRLGEFDGTIMLDQREAREIDDGGWRRMVVGVRQEAQAFQGSLRDNIAYGMSPAPDESTLRHACYLSCLDEFINARTEGLDFQVAPNGENLSGGEKMRLAIARALVRAPGVLLLDEPTAALDALTEQRLMQRIKASGITTIVASHSRACLAFCDRIYVLASGSAGCCAAIGERVNGQCNGDERIKWQENWP